MGKLSLICVCIFCGLMAVGLAGCGGQGCDRSLIEAEGIVARGAVLETISTEFEFTEGPISDRAGNVYFTDQPNNQIMVYTVEGGLETFMRPAGRANGLYFDNDGYLLACADENSELWKIDVETKEYEVLAHEYNGVRLNSTNDLWVRPDGGIYFSDPFYKRSWWEHEKPTQDGECVYYLMPGSGGPVRVIDDMVRPNGLIGTADGKVLYVSDIGAGRIYKYEVLEDGGLAGKQLFCEMGSDGMTIDCCGNVYLTNNRGVVVFDREGKQVENIKIPAGWTANVTFGGADGKMLFVTAQKGVYSIRMNVSN